ncbi:MAG: hypothetical protein ACM67Q_04295 [Clostridiales bacterium]|mgnify:CR=1 FL=1
MTVEEFSDKLWVTFVLPKVREFIDKNSFTKTKINNFIKTLNEETDRFCNVNGFKKEFTFEASYKDNIFSIEPTHIFYKDKISQL